MVGGEEGGGRLLLSSSLINDFFQISISLIFAAKFLRNIHAHNRVLRFIHIPFHISSSQTFKVSQIHIGRQLVPLRTTVIYVSNYFDNKCEFCKNVFGILVKHSKFNNTLIESLLNNHLKHFSYNLQPQKSSNER